MLEVKDYDAPELLGELLLFEISPEYCRDALTIKAAETETPLGAVLMRNPRGADLMGAPSDPAAAGVLLRAVPASASNTAAPVLKRGALVSAAALKWPAGTAEDKKGAALAALEALGIIAR